MMTKKMIGSFLFSCVAIFAFAVTSVAQDPAPETQAASAPSAPTTMPELDPNAPVNPEGALQGEEIAATVEGVPCPPCGPAMDGGIIVNEGEIMNEGTIVEGPMPAPCLSAQPLGGHHGFHHGHHGHHGHRGHHGHHGFHHGHRGFHQGHHGFHHGHHGFHQGGRIHHGFHGSQGNFNYSPQIAAPRVHCVGGRCYSVPTSGARFSF